MKERSSLWIAALAIVALVVVVLMTNQPVNVYNTDDQVRKVSVSATAELEVEPDQVEVWIAVNTLRDSAKEAQDENAREAEKIIDALLEAGADMEAKERNGQTAMMWAAAEGNLEAVRILMDAGADYKTPLSGGFTPFYFAIREGASEWPSTTGRARRRL